MKSVSERRKMTPAEWKRENHLRYLRDVIAGRNGARLDISTRVRYGERTGTIVDYEAGQPKLHLDGDPPSKFCIVAKGSVMPVACPLKEFAWNQNPS